MAEKVKVRPRTAIHYPLGGLTPAGVEVEVPFPIAEEWVARGLAEIILPAIAESDGSGLHSAPAPLPKGKRSDR